VLRNLVPQGYQAIALCNAHLEPAHVAGVTQAAQAIGDETGVPMVFPDKREPRWAARLSAEFRRGSRHAGSYETSLILSAFPDRARSATANSLPPVWIDLPAQLRAGARTFTEAGSPLGYFGDPASASRAEGERLWEGLTSMIYDAVMEVPAVRQNATGGTAT
jgi:creatinine amidohydrolase